MTKKDMTNCILEYFRNNVGNKVSMFFKYGMNGDKICFDSHLFSVDFHTSYGIVLKVSLPLWLSRGEIAGRFFYFETYYGDILSLLNRNSFECMYDNRNLEKQFLFQIRYPFELINAKVSNYNKEEISEKDIKKEEVKPFNRFEYLDLDD